MSASSEVAWQRVARLEELDPAIPHGVPLSDGTRVCLVLEGTQVFAVEDRCPHRDFALSGGDVVAPCVLECPWHGAQFDVRSGNVLRGPATDAIRTFDVKVEGGVVLVATPTSTHD